MPDIGTRLYTFFRGEKVGEDTYGNTYFQKAGGAKRWVVYKGLNEASKVPAEWHGWLHYTENTVPDGKKGFGWQKAHLPNLTGTDLAYRPPGHVLRGAKRHKATGDYEAWVPGDQ